MVSLMRGEPDFRTPPHIIEAAERALRNGRTSYPDNRGEIELRKAVAWKINREQNLSYDPATEVLVTTGATFGIYAALTAVLNEGEMVMMPEPIYDAYRSPVMLAGATVRDVAAARDGDRFVLHVEDLEAAHVPGCRILLLNTPWNPTGTVFKRTELEAICDFVLRKDMVLLSDEIYEAITYDGAEHISAATLSPEIRERTILINSFSKTYAMTGWRVGYCAAPAPITQAMFLVLQQSSRGPATFIQDASAEALTGSQECVKEMRIEYSARRALVMESLSGIAKCRVLPPEGGFFALVDVSETGRASNDARRRLLEDAGVVVIHGAAYGPTGEGTLRVSYASGGETLFKGLERLRQGLSAL